VLIPSRSAGTIEVFAVGKSGGVPDGTLTAVGAPVPTGPPGSRPFAIAFNRRNNVFYVSHLAGGGGGDPPILSTFRLDPSTGAVTAIGTPISTNGAGLASANLHPSGRFLLQHNSSTSSVQVFTIDPTTFAPTLQPNATAMSPVVVDFSGKYLYAANASAGTVSSYRFDTTTGAITLVGTVPAGLSPTVVSPFGFQPQ
jgi:6-phosphogluconolactonase (cycloisomerase 2 family)